MKLKLLSFTALLFGIFLKAQQSDLMNTAWQITKIVYGSQTYLPPPMPYPQGTHFYANTSSAPNITASFFNIMSGHFNFDNSNNTFSKNDAACTLADYWADGGLINQFSDLNCGFFIMPASGNFSYLITTTSTQKNLVITNPVGNQIFYTAALLNTGESPNSKNKTSIYPNPANEILTLKNLDPNSKIHFYDIHGKLVFNRLTTNEKIVLVSLANLEAGVYFVKVNDNAVFKFIKN